MNSVCGTIYSQLEGGDGVMALQKSFVQSEMQIVFSRIKTSVSYSTFYQNNQYTKCVFSGLNT